MVAAIKGFLWRWLFDDFARKCDDRVNYFLKEKSSEYQQEQRAFMVEFRENMREDLVKKEKEQVDKERRHQELVSAIISLK